MTQLESHSQQTPAAVIDDYFELRLYELRPNSQEEMLRRMTGDFASLLRRADMPDPIAVWTGITSGGKGLYACLTQWGSLDSLMQRWGLLRSDPRWPQAFQKGIGLGSLVDQTDVYILRPLSPKLSFQSVNSTGPSGRLQEWRFIEILNRDAKLGHEALLTTELPFFQQRGATVLGAYMVWFGTATPKAALLLDWLSYPVRAKALAEYESDREVQEVRANERQRFGRPLFGRCEAFFLHPVES